MTTPRQQRVLRAAAAATLATFVALLSHVAAGGALPAVLGIALPWALSLVVCVVCVGRRLSLVRLSAAVLAAQAIFHVLFGVGLVPAGVEPRGPSNAGLGTHAAHAGHGGHIPLPVFTAEGSVPAFAHLDLGMLVGHLVAAAITVFALHRGEVLLVALRSLAQRIGLRLRRHALPVGLVAVPARVRAATAGEPPRYRRPLVAAPARRGPPVLSVV